MWLLQILHQLRKARKRWARVVRPPTSRTEMTWRRLELENLEDRVVPTILFTPQNGVEHATTAGGSVMGTVAWGMPIYTIFWGSYWNTPAGVTYSNNIENALNSMFYTSAYLDGLHQYGVVYRAGVSGSGTVRVFNYSNPNPSGFPGSDVFNVMANGIQHQGLPHPNDFTIHGVYFVITQPGAFQAGCGCGGYHTFGTVDGQRTEWGWISTNGTLDNATYIISHETAETMSDPHGDAWQVDLRSGSAWNEISDNEAQSYTYRLNGYQMQAYWSQSALSYQVSDGNQQKFFLNPIWTPSNTFTGTYNLLVQGDQLGVNDVITVDVSSAGGVLITLNGETAQFDPYQIRGITINTGSGTNTVNIEGTASGAPVSITVGGNGATTVNVSPSAIRSGKLQAGITFDGASGGEFRSTSATLNVNDSGDPSDRSWEVADFQLQDGALGSYLSGSALGLAVIAYANLTNFHLVGGNGHDAIEVGWTAGAVHTRIDGGSSNEHISVDGTAPGTDVTVYQGSGVAVIPIAESVGHLDAIAGNVTVHGTGTAVLVVNDQHPAPSPTYTITSNSVTRTGSGASITYDGVASLIVNTSNSGATINVQSTAPITTTTVNRGSGHNTVNVAQSTHNLDNLTFFGNHPLILNGGSTSDALIVFDQADPHPGTRYSIINSSLFRISVGGPPYHVLDMHEIDFGQLASITLFTSNAGSDIGVPLPGKPSPALFVHGGTGLNTLDYSAFTTGVFVNLGAGMAPGLASFDGIQGVIGGSGNDVLIGGVANATLRAGSGRSLLICGKYAAHLIGGSGDDILIAGSTVYDNDPLSLSRMMYEWTRTDLPGSALDQYKARIDHLMHGTGKTGGVVLDRSKIINNGLTDTLTGGSGLDWFFATAFQDIIQNKRPEEIIT